LDLEEWPPLSRTLSLNRVLIEEIDLSKMNNICLVRRISGGAMITVGDGDGDGDGDEKRKRLVRQGKARQGKVR
jgi:hypothetical protein